MKVEIYRKDGKLKEMYRTTIQEVIRGTKIFPARWIHRGRYNNLIDRTQYVIDLLNYFGYKYKQGNDAPRGGLEGFYIKISKRALERIKSLIS